MAVLQNILASDRGTEACVAERPPIKKALVFTIVALALLMMTVDSTIIATALHTLQNELHTSINWAGWTLTAYSFGFVLMLPISGILSERYGHRRIFILSITTFTLVSLFCGLSDNIYLLIALRVVQAIGGAGITPSATGLIVTHFGDSRDRAVSLFGSIFPVGAMIGPIFGGLFVTYWSWRGIFFVNIPIGIAVVVMAMRYIPTDPDLDKKDHSTLDISGIIMMGVGILAGMFAVSYLGEKDARALSAVFISLVVVCIVFLFAFLRHSRRAVRPIIAPRLMFGKGFGAVNLVNILYGGITQGVIALVPLYAANRYGINALNSGILLVAEGVAAVVLSTSFTMMLRKTGYRLPLYMGCVVLTIGTALLALRPMGGLSPYAWLMISTFLIGAGSGTINPSCRNAGLQLAPEQSSTIAALRSMFMQIGSIITIGIAAAIITGTQHPGNAQAEIYFAAVVVFALCFPLIAHIQEHKGGW